MKQEKLVKTLYYFFTLCIILGAAFVYRAWWDRYFRLRPELAVAEPAVLSIDVPMEATLVWEEEMVLSPAEGTVSFLKGSGPVYCARGDTVAVLSGPSGKRVIKAPRPGYFIAALDGSEGNWSYGDLWPGSSSLPRPGPLLFISEGAKVRAGEPLGKMIPQPQQLRCVAYLDKTAYTGDLDSRKNLELKKALSELPFRTEVRAVKDLGPALKVYLSLPFFSGEDLRSRSVTFLFHAGQMRGVMIPESAVVMRNRKKVVFLVTGDRSKAVEVSGTPVSGKRFLVESGLAPGDLVIISGADAEEGEVRLW
ncbi:MAG: efflux RND transporter periplasmic adaptor subunit [Thermovirgaceae bacterium]|nr:efflux RND transporter periplasmic adaptor subunit [Thermovirgaceae bacterium]